MVYVPLDVNYQDDDKIMAAGPICELVYIRSLALAKRLLSDGRISSRQLCRLTEGLTVWDTMNGENPRPEELAQSLVEVGLWVTIPDGWLIAAWGKHNPAAETFRTAGTYGNHQRWHVQRGVGDPTCPWCRNEGDSASDRVGESPPDIAPRSGGESEGKGREGKTNTVGRAAVSVPDGFGEWWAEYPRKVARQDAMAKYAKALSLTTPAVLLAALVAHKRMWEVEDRPKSKIPHASTWLHQQRWLDELDEVDDDEGGQVVRLSHDEMRALGIVS